MPVYSIQAPNGKTYQVEGPEGASQDQVQAEVLRQYPEASGEQQPLDVTITDTGDYGAGASEAPKDDSRLNAFVNGLIKPVDNLVSAARQIPGVAAADDAISGLLGVKSGGETVQANDAARADDTRTGYQMLGNIAGTLPTLVMPGGALVQGGAAGALLSDGNNAFDVGKDALMGAALSKGGEVALRGLARAASPQISDNLRTLIDAGVRVTPGQVARSEGGAVGRFLARSEDRAISTPFVGDQIAGARNKSLETFGRATINRALEPIGQSLPEGIGGRNAVRYAGDKLGEAYDAVLPRLSATGDRQFLDDLASVHEEAAMMEPSRARQFENILGSLNRYWQDGVALDGRALKEIETRIGDRVRRAAMSTDADQRELGDRLGDVLSAVRDLAARQNPAEAEALSSINRGWKSLTQVERAAGNSRSEITPAGYSQAVKMSSDTVRRRGYARGEALNQDLADAGSEILPSQIADSGTAGRWQQSNILANVIGAAQIPGYAAAQGASRVLTRDPTMTSDTLAQLLRYGAAATPVIAPASIHAISK